MKSDLKKLETAVVRKQIKSASFLSNFSIIHGFMGWCKRPFCSLLVWCKTMLTFRSRVAEGCALGSKMRRKGGNSLRGQA